MHDREPAANAQNAPRFPLQIGGPLQVKQVVDHRVRLRAVNQARALCDKIPRFGADVVDPLLCGLVSNGRDHVRFDVENLTMPETRSAAGKVNVP